MPLQVPFSVMMLLGVLGLWGCSGSQVNQTVATLQGNPPVPSQSTAPQRLDGLAEELRVQGKLPALAVAVMDANGIWAVGVAGKTHAAGRAVVGQERFHLGSNTKSMTATLVARLVENGTLKWTTTLRQLFPKRDVHPKLAQVTVEQLLRHESGMTAWTDPAKMLSDWRVLKATTLEGVTKDRAKLASLLLKRGPDTAVGSYAYSNAGYVVLGAALEALTNKSWEALMVAQVFQPLEMSRCGFGPMATQQSPDNVRGHMLKDGAFQTVPIGPLSDNPPAMGPAGTVHCDLDGWSNYVRVHLGNGPKGYLSPETIARLHTANPKSKYAYGWIAPKPMLLAHEGSNGMNHAFILANKNRAMALLILTNAGPPPSIKAILQNVVTRLIGVAKQRKLPKDAPVQPN